VERAVGAEREGAYLVARAGQGGPEEPLRGQVPQLRTAGRSGDGEGPSVGGEGERGDRAGGVRRRVGRGVEGKAVHRQGAVGFGVDDHGGTEAVGPEVPHRDPGAVR
jgi:hypothetical protein